MKPPKHIGGVIQLGQKSKVPVEQKAGRRDQNRRVKNVTQEKSIWCSCPKEEKLPVPYDDRPKGGHGWVCGHCGGLIQVG